MEGVVKSKDAVIKSLVDQLQNPGVQLSLKDLHRLSPSLSSAADAQRAEETPLDKSIREWVEKAQLSISSTAGYRLTDGRVVDESDSDSSGSPKGLGNPLSPTKTKSSVSDSGRSTGRLAAPDQPHTKNSPKLHSLPLETAPIGLLANLAIQDSRETNEKRARSRSKSRSLSGEDNEESLNDDKSTGEGEEDPNAVGIASKDYFQPASNLGLRTIETERKDLLEIMTSGLISPAEVDKLFKIFFDRLNVRTSFPPLLHPTNLAYSGIRVNSRSGAAYSSHYVRPFSLPLYSW